MQLFKGIVKDQHIYCTHSLVEIMEKAYICRQVINSTEKSEWDTTVHDSIAHWNRIGGKERDYHILYNTSVFSEIVEGV